MLLPTFKNNAPALAQLPSTDMSSPPTHQAPEACGQDIDGACNLQAVNQDETRFLTNLMGPSVT